MIESREMDLTGKGGFAIKKSFSIFSLGSSARPKCLAENGLGLKSHRKSKENSEIFFSFTNASPREASAKISDSNRLRPQSIVKRLVIILFSIRL